MTFTISDMIGNIGVLFIVGTYLLIQIERLSSQSLWYSALNGAGALLIMISLCFAFNLSAFLIEFFWLLISLVGIYRSMRARRQS